jgi:hypothetical protein
MTLGAMAELTADDLALIAAPVHDKPDAVIVGRPDPMAAANDRQTRWRRRRGNFWYRMQTGIALDDIRAGLCIYPLTGYEWLLGSLLLGPGLAVLAGAAVYLTAVIIRQNLVK